MEDCMTPNTDNTEVNLCKGCGTMKHLDDKGLCGRCNTDNQQLRDKVADIANFTKIGKKRIKYVSYYDDELSTTEVDETDTVNQLEALIVEQNLLAFESGVKNYVWATTPAKEADKHIEMFFSLWKRNEGRAKMAQTEAALNKLDKADKNREA